jgi:hypothetical protein
MMPQSQCDTSGWERVQARFCLVQVIVETAKAILADISGQRQ